MVEVLVRYQSLQLVLQLFVSDLTCCAPLSMALRLVLQVLSSCVGGVGVLGGIADLGSFGGGVFVRNLVRTCAGVAIDTSVVVSILSARGFA